MSCAGKSLLDRLRIAVVPAEPPGTDAGALFLEKSGHQLAGKSVRAVEDDPRPASPAWPPPVPVGNDFEGGQ